MPQCQIENSNFIRNYLSKEAFTQMKKVTTPLTDDVLAELTTGDEVLLTGVIYTARDAAHRRIVEAVNNGQAPPIDLQGQIIYYVGPTPPRPGEIIGSAGPTTAYRMDPFTPKMLELGVKACIGKGLHLHQNQMIIFT